MLNLNKVSKFIPLLDSGYFFSNKKTGGAAVDFRLCPLMKLVAKSPKVKVESPKCAGCYSANVINIYKNVGNKIINLPDTKDEGQLKKFESDCAMLKAMFPAFQRLRFYALADFHKDDIPYIKAASQYFTVDIISKTLVQKHNEPYLRELFNLPNVWVSLSFNKDYLKGLLRIKTLLATEKPSNVNMNYTLNYRDENPDDSFFDHFQVFHLKNDDKRGGLDKFERLTNHNVCAIFGRDGEPVKAKGTCDKCNICHVSYTQYMDGQRAKPPQRAVA